MIDKSLVSVQQFKLIFWSHPAGLSDFFWLCAQKLLQAGCGGMHIASQGLNLGPPCLSKHPTHCDITTGLKFILNMGHLHLKKISPAQHL